MYTHVELWNCAHSHKAQLKHDIQWILNSFFFHFFLSGVLWIKNMLCSVEQPCTIWNYMCPYLFYCMWFENHCEWFYDVVPQWKHTKSRTVHWTILDGVALCMWIVSLEVIRCNGNELAWMLLVKKSGSKCWKDRNANGGKNG